MSSSLSLWLDEPHTPRPALGGDAECEVCVIGAGIGGIALAWRLAGRGLDVCVLDAGVVAGGATGRNGGFFLAGQAPNHDEACRLWGRAAAARRYAATLAAQEEMLAVAGAIGAAEHFDVCGLLRLGVDAEDVQGVRAHHAALAADGFPGVLLDEADLPRVLRRPGRVGLLTPHDGVVHPVRWVRALAAAAEEQGARIHERSEVLAPVGADGLVRTATGTVRAEHVVVAADGALRALVPEAVSVRPRRLQMLATAPLPDRVLPFPVYARDGHEYAQQRPDGRITLGGFSDLDGPASWTDHDAVSAPVQDRLEAYLHQDLGITTTVTHRWAGIVGYADNPLPTCGKVPGTPHNPQPPSGKVPGTPHNPQPPSGKVPGTLTERYAMGGYNGTGHVQAWVAARIVAEMIVAGSSGDADLFAPVSG